MHVGTGISFFPLGLKPQSVYYFVKKITSCLGSSHSNWHRLGAIAHDFDPTGYEHQLFLEPEQKTPRCSHQ